MSAEPKVYDIPVQENGRMILPAALRRRLGIEKGDRLVVEDRDGSVSLTTARERRRRAQRIAAKYARAGGGAVDAFLEDKRAEVEREEAELDIGTERR